MNKLLRWLITLWTALACSVAISQTLIIESWRTEDQDLWDKVLLPAFHARYPDIRVRFAPTARALYDQTLLTRLEKGIAGDIITCRPFDASRELFTLGHLMALDGQPALRQFLPAALRAWRTTDGKKTYCLPVASVMHGIFYNRTLMRKAGLSEPVDLPAWFKSLEHLRKSPDLVPLAFGTADRWESHQVLFTGLGPSFWQGERGRQALISGRARLTDPVFVQAWSALEKLTPFLPQGYPSLSYEDALNLFAQGKAAMYPGGSWEINSLRRNPQLDLGVFHPPPQRAGDPCYVSDHIDHGLGINALNPRPKAALLFMEWVASAEFSQLYANAAVGFYPLSKHAVNIKDPLASAMLAWRQRCQTTIRLNAEQLNRTTHKMEEAFWDASAMVMNHHLTPTQAATRLQRALDRP